MNAFGWSCLVLGVLGLISTLRTMEQHREFRSQSVPATATVMPYETRVQRAYDNPHDITMYHLTMRMELPGRGSFNTVEDIGTSWIPYPVGTVLRVHYKRVNPLDFRLDKRSGRDFQVRFMGLFSITCILIAMLFGIPMKENDEIVSMPGNTPSGQQPMR